MTNNITAQQAYDLAMSKLDPIDTTEEFEKVMVRIREAAEQGSIACWTDAMDLLKVEKLGLELEVMGFTCTASPLNSTVNGLRQYALAINWKYLTTNTRERLN